MYKCWRSAKPEAGRVCPLPAKCPPSSWDWARAVGIFFLADSPVGRQGPGALSATKGLQKGLHCFLFLHCIWRGGIPPSPYMTPHLGAQNHWGVNCGRGSLRGGRWYLFPLRFPSWHNSMSPPPRRLPVPLGRDAPDLEQVLCDYVVPMVPR